MDVVSQSIKSYLDLEECFNAIGTSMMSTDMATSTVALFNVSSNDETWVLNKPLCCGLLTAKKKAGLEGGCIPDIDFISEMRRKSTILKNEGEKTYFLDSLRDRYGSCINDILKHIKK